MKELNKLNVYVGKRIKEYRERKKLTQEYMATILDIAPNHYGRIERGENSCTLANLIVICNHLQITPNELLGKLIITADSNIDCDFNKLNLEDKLVISKMTDFLLSKY
ncbi:MAG: helix-turn-helix transcriptional regulator [Clostridia bacterium]